MHQKKPISYKINDYQNTETGSDYRFSRHTSNLNKNVSLKLALKSLECLFIFLFIWWLISQFILGESIYHLLRTEKHV